MLKTTLFKGINGYVDNAQTRHERLVTVNADCVRLIKKIFKLTVKTFITY